MDKLFYKPLRQKSKKEIHADQIYNRFLSKVIIPMVGKTETYSTDLNKAGLEIFGSLFKGVYPSDRIPKLNILKQYAIINLDKSNEPGSHWVSIAWKNGNIYLYDSFGREGKNILKALRIVGGKIMEADHDAEQHESQSDCGARSLAWLLVFHRHGADVAMLI